MNEILNVLETVNWSLIIPILFVQLILMIIALIDCIRHEETNGPKWLWIFIIVFANIIGPILYFVVGRKND